MNPQNVFKRSPFFYVGDKYKLLGEIKKYFPKKIDTFVEPFLGGGSIFMNVEAKNYILNDINKNVISLHRFLTGQATQEKKILNKIKKIAEEYNLSRSLFEDVVPTVLKKKWPKTYYAEYNRVGYNLLRTDYNKKNDSLFLYLLLIYGFNRILRFNNKGEFNIPVGNVDFNKNVLDALKDYFSIVIKRKPDFHNKDFKNFIKGLKLKKNDFVYIDPPYLISASEYNKLWNKKLESDLLYLIDELDKKGIRFALSNVTHYNGDKNDLLIKWMRKYKVHQVKSNYINYHNNKQKQINEVLITNY